MGGTRLIFKSKYLWLGTVVLNMTVLITVVTRHLSRAVIAVNVPVTLENINYVKRSLK